MFLLLMHPGPALAEELHGDYIALQDWVRHGPSLAGTLGSHGHGYNCLEGEADGGGVGSS